MDHRMLGGGTDGVHFVFVVDILLKPNFDVTMLSQCMDTILAFGNSLLMQSGANKLTILGSSSVKNTVLHMDSDSLSKKIQFNGQQMETFAEVTTSFRVNFLEWIQRCTELSQSSPASNVSMLSGAIAQGLCMINRYRSEYKHSRVIVFSLGSDQSDSYSSQYMKLINCFFAAQKIDVTLDACSVTLSRESEEKSNLISASMEDRFAASILQQGCDLTGGRYIRVHKVSTLLQHLFWCFTPSAQERPQLVLPPKLKISPPAACFCHRKVLEVGYVCSVCVSIFCQYLPFCTTCNSNVFVNSLKKIAQLKSDAKENGTI